jgi:hypothetical protein
VLVRVSDAAADSDDFGGTAAIVETITDGLVERGVANEIFAADDDNPPAPRIEVWVEHWDAGNRGKRAVTSLAADTAGIHALGVAGGGLVGALAMSGGYLVVSKIYPEGGSQPYVCRYSGKIMSREAEASTDKGESVGTAILEDAFRKPRAGHCK